MKETPAADFLAGKSRLLLIHGEAPSLQALTYALRVEGYTVFAVAGGVPALAALRTDLREVPPDLILATADLPDMTWDDFAARLKAGDGAEDAPVIGVLATADVAAAARLLAAGAADVIKSPFAIEEVLVRIRAQMQLRQLNRRLAESTAALQREISARRRTESALQNAEASGQHLVENLTEVIFTTDGTGLLTYVSPTFQRLVGYDSMVALGRRLVDFAYADDAASLGNHVQLVLTGRGVTDELRLVAADGSVRWVRFFCQPVVSAGGVVGTQGLLADVTERREAERRIRYQNDFLTHVLESLTYPFYVIDARDYTIQVANSAARAAGRAGATSCYALTHGREIACEGDEHPCPIEEVKRTGRPVRVTHLHYDNEDRPRYVEVHGYPLLDDRGEVTRVIEYELDVTERAEVEAELRRSERRYRDLLNALREGIWVIDAEANTTFVNPRMAEMLGYTVDEMLGRPVFSFMDAPGVTITRRNLERRRKGIREQHDFEFRRKDGGRLYVSMETSPVTDENGTYTGSIAGVQDITEQRLAQEALVKSEALLQETQRIARLGGWELNADTSELTCTDEIYRILELSPGTQLGLQDALAFYDPDDRRVLEAAVQRAVAVGAPYDLELRLTTATGRPIWVRAIGRVVPGDGQGMRLTGTLRDITQRKAGEQALLEAVQAAEAAQQAEAQRRQVAEGLADVLAALNSHRALEEVLDQIAGQARLLLGCEAAVIAAPPVTVTRGIARDVAMDPACCPSVAVLAELMAGGVPVVICDLHNGTTPEAVVACVSATYPSQYGALLAVPVTVKDEVLGGIILYYHDLQAFSDEQVGLARVFGHQVALALDNERLRAQAETTAAMAERNRLARDLHDSVTQALFSASLVADSLPRVWQRDAAQAVQGLEELRALTRGALAEMRTLLVELRPTALMEGQLGDLLRQLVTAATSRIEIEVVTEIGPVGDLPPEVKVAAYRIAQEALHNVVKHAGAHRLRVELRALPTAEARDPATAQDQPRLWLRVWDDGRGFDPHVSHPDRLGLSIMRERAASVGAQMSILSRPGEGTDLTLVWPGEVASDAAVRSSAAVIRP